MWTEIENFEDIRYERTDDGVARITINRPEVRNAFRPQTVKEMLVAFERAHEDAEVGVIILRGEGDLAFCSGGDQKVRDHAGYVGGDGVPRLNILEVQKKIRTIPKPVIASVAGYAIGGGHVLHVVCDLSIAADNARFGQTGPKVGSFDGGLGASYLSRIVGQKKAREIWYLCRQYDAQQALDMGLVNTVVPLADLEDETLKWAREILQHSPMALRCLKAALNADCDGQQGLLDLAGNATLLYYMTEEAKEGRNAFVEKREPDFSKFPVIREQGMKSWILAARPKTLPAAVVPVWVGSYALLPIDDASNFSSLLFASTLMSCVCIQIATNLFNDAIDFDKGADTENRLGPRRATASGLLSRKAVFGGAVGFCALAAVIATPMILARGWPIVAIGGVSLLLAYGYTGGPVPLAYKGLGELFVIVFFGLIAVGGSWYVQTGLAPNGLVVLSGIQIGLLSAVLIAVNNLRDVDEDRSSNKRTLAVRFGVGFARVEIAAFAFGALAIGFVWWQNHYRGAFWFPLFLAPLAGWLVVKIWKTPPGHGYNRFLALSAALLLGFGILFTIGMLKFP